MFQLLKSPTIYTFLAPLAAMLGRRKVTLHTFLVLRYSFFNPALVIVVFFDVDLFAGGEELALAASQGFGAFQSFTGLNEYSNIDGAIGVFSTVSSASSHNNRFSDFTIDYIASSDSTGHLGFLKHDQDF